jgi:L-asparaginase
MQELIHKKTKKLVFFGTGGTISGVSTDPNDALNYQAGVIGVRDLANSLGIDEQNTQFEAVFEQISQIDSKDMSFDVWRALLERLFHWSSDPDVQGFLITHGTDTLEETAFFLSAVLANQTALPTVVLTCAMRAATDPKADGPQNIRDSVAVLLNEAFRNAGVLVVCAGQIHAGACVQKVYTDRLNAFTSEPYPLLGDIVREGLLTEEYHAKQTHSQKTPRIQQLAKPLTSLDIISDQKLIWPTLEQVLQNKDWPWVEIIQNQVNSGAQTVEALLSYKTNKALRGIVLAGTGMGTASESLMQALTHAQSEQVMIWQSSRCAFAQLSVRRELGFYDFHGLSPVKARIALTLHLLALGR